MAHKKAGGSSRNGRDSEFQAPWREEVRRRSRHCRATSSCVSAAPSGIRAPMSASARITPFLRLRQATWTSVRRPMAAYTCL